MKNWVKISDEEMKLGMSIANLKKGELQIKYVKDVCRLNNIINELEKWIKANDIHYAEALPFKETLRKLKELKENYGILVTK